MNFQIILEQPPLTLESAKYQDVGMIGGCGCLLNKNLLIILWLLVFKYLFVLKSDYFFFRTTFWLTSKETEMSPSRAICISDPGEAVQCSKLLTGQKNPLVLLKKPPHFFPWLKAHDHLFLHSIS